MNNGDVYRLQIPYGKPDNKLRTTRHMYIVRECKGSYVELIKTDKLKYPIRCKTFIIRQPNPNDNPFKRKTIVDCDKFFTTNGIIYPDSIRTKNKPRISDDFLEEIQKKSVGAKEEVLDKHETLKLNPRLMDDDEF